MKNTTNDTPIQYRKLPGKGLRRQGLIALARIHCTLWLADDHVLSVDDNLFSEDYKRFYFRDIQAIVLKKTARGMVWNIILSLLVALWLLIAIVQDTTMGQISLLVVAGIFGVVLTINVLRGPTCDCHLITAVHKEMLPSLQRIKTAEKTLRILRRQIEKTQGKFSRMTE